MKLTRNKSKNQPHREKLTDHELREIQILNSDRARSYPEIDRNARSTRVPIVAHALTLWPNRYTLCRATAKTARMIHNPNDTRVPHSINRAMKMLSQAESLMPVGTKGKTAAVVTKEPPAPSLSLIMSRPQPLVGDVTVHPVTQPSLFLVHGEAV